MADRSATAPDGRRGGSGAPLSCGPPPVHADRDRFALPLDGDAPPGPQEPQDRLALRRRGGGRPPQRWASTGEPPNGLPLRGSQGPRVGGEPAVGIRGERLVRRAGGLALAFQGPRHEAMRGLDRVLRAHQALDRRACARAPGRPWLGEWLPCGFPIRRHGQTPLEGRGFERRPDQGAHPGRARWPPQRLTAGSLIGGLGLAAAGAESCPLMRGDAPHPHATAATHDQACQERRTTADRALRRLPGGRPWALGALTRRPAQGGRRGIVPPHRPRGARGPALARRRAPGWLASGSGRAAPVDIRPGVQGMPPHRGAGAPGGPPPRHGPCGRPRGAPLGPCHPLLPQRAQDAPHRGLAGTLGKDQLDPRWRLGSRVLDHGARGTAQRAHRALHPQCTALGLGTCAGQQALGADVPRGCAPRALQPSQAPILSIQGIIHAVALPAQRAPERPACQHGRPRAAGAGEARDSEAAHQPDVGSAPFRAKALPARAAVGLVGGCAPILVHPQHPLLRPPKGQRACTEAVWAPGRRLMAQPWRGRRWADSPHGQASAVRPRHGGRAPGADRGHHGQRPSPAC
jgi:hypothetical protein